VAKICETKRARQKSAGRTPTRVSGRISRISLADPDFGRARQTKPISPRARHRASLLSEKSYDRSDLHRTPEKQTQFRQDGTWRARQACRRRSSEQSRQTKPISAHAGRVRAGKPGNVTVGPIVPNKANWPGAASPGKSRGAGFCETKPIPTRGSEGQVLCEKRVMTNQTCKGLRQNKANFRADLTGGPAAYRCGGEPIVRNKPNFPWPRPARLPAPSVGAIVRNEPNLPCTDTPKVPGGRLRRNKANFRGQAEARDRPFALRLGRTPPSSVRPIFVGRDIIRVQPSPRPSGPFGSAQRLPPKPTEWGQTQSQATWSAACRGRFGPVECRFG
jgi:hypothetical protein